jgi:hypothetical protein
MRDLSSKPPQRKRELVGCVNRLTISSMSYEQNGISARTRNAKPGRRKANRSEGWIGWKISHDWKRRLELIGINPVTFEIEDTKEFVANVGLLNFTRKQREKRKDERRKRRGVTRPYYAKEERGSVPYIPPEPPPSESTSTGPLLWRQVSDDGEATTGQSATGNFWKAWKERLLCCDVCSRTR